MENGGGSLWLLMSVGGVVIIGIAIAYGMIRNRRVTPADHARTERKTEEVYAQESDDPANR